MTLTPIDPTSEIAVTDYLTKARDWLDKAVETSTPHNILGAKAELRVAEEATKQLGLSRDIQLDAQEMVRRAEFALAKSVKKGQDEGRIATRANNPGPRREYERNGSTVRPGDQSNHENKVSPSEYLGQGKTRQDLSEMSDWDDEDFDAAVAEAKAEENLSRANVARKAAEKAAEKTGSPRASRRKPLPEFARDAGWDLRKAVERLERISDDDRFVANKEQVAAHLRSHLSNAVEVCQDLLARIDNN